VLRPTQSSGTFSQTQRKANAEALLFSPVIYTAISETGRLRGDMRYPTEDIAVNRCSQNSALGNSNVVVLIPHHNDLGGLNRSLSSLATEHVAAVVVDNASATPPRTASLRAAHPYLEGLHIIHLAENIGIAQALNVGMSYASNFAYIARLDCNDICLPGRIEQQRAFLDTHPDCHLVGCWVEAVDQGSEQRHILRFPTEQADIFAAMYKRNVFCHSATMFRRSSALALGGYPPRFRAAEDYALFFAMAKKYQVANIPEVLVQCRTTQKSQPACIVRARMLSSIRIIARNMQPGYLLCASKSIASASGRLALGIDGATS
jgi:glycosyltransferase involved in cell wall biosynthesis